MKPDHVTLLRIAIQKLIAASDALTAAIEPTGQFEREKADLMDATSAAEKVLILV